MLSTFLCTTANSAIYEADRISDVKELFYEEELWVLVDLDNCLFEASQALGHANWFYDLVKEKIENGMSKIDAVSDTYPDWLNIQKNCSVKPVEREFVQLIKALQDKGVIVMGLTHRQPCAEMVTTKQVESLGISFSNSAVWDKEFCPKAIFEALYSEGIIFVHDGNSKGDVFKSFVGHIGKMPKKVLFIDDKLKNVTELKKVMDEMNIHYSGIHYIALTKKDPVYSRELADIQGEFFDRILTNEEAHLFIESK